VVHGSLKSRESERIEIIDLETSGTTCSPIQDLPLESENLYGAVGHLFSNDIPVICGGYTTYVYHSECYKFEDGAWKPFQSLSLPRYHASVVESPFATGPRQMFITGGLREQNEDLFTSEMFIGESWDDNLPWLPVKLSSHCAVLLNATTVMVIAGESRSDNHKTHSATYIFNAQRNLYGNYNEGYSNNSWVQGPPLSMNRSQQSCGKIRRSLDDKSFSVVVVGGIERDLLSSVEVLDEGSNEWRAGPDLPFGIYGATLVEDPAGGVVLIGGSSSRDSQHETMLRLAHAGDDAEWLELPQKLKNGRYLHTSFLIPDHLTKCTVN
jgi:hypothetical protein